MAAKSAASYAPLSSPGLAGSYLEGVSTLAQPGPVTHRCVPFLTFDKRAMHLFHPPADIQHIQVLPNCEHLNVNDTAKIGNDLIISIFFWRFLRDIIDHPFNFIDT